VIRLQTALGEQLFDIAERERVPKYQRTAHRISPGAVCRHLKITGRVALFTVFSAYQPSPPNLQHIRLGRSWKNCERTCKSSRRRPYRRARSVRPSATRCATGSPDALHRGRPAQDRQQRGGAGATADRARPQKLALCRQRSGGAPHRHPLFAGADVQASADQSVRVSARCHRARLDASARLVLELTPREWTRRLKDSAAKAAPERLFLARNPCVHGFPPTRHGRTAVSSRVELQEDRFCSSRILCCENWNAKVRCRSLLPSGQILWIIAKRKAVVRPKSTSRSVPPKRPSTATDLQV